MPMHELQSVHKSPACELGPLNILPVLVDVAQVSSIKQVMLLVDADTIVSKHLRDVVSESMNGTDSCGAKQSDSIF